MANRNNNHEARSLKVRESLTTTPKNSRRNVTESCQVTILQEGGVKIIPIEVKVVSASRGEPRTGRSVAAATSKSRTDDAKKYNIRQAKALLDAAANGTLEQLVYNDDGTIDPSSEAGRR